MSIRLFLLSIAFLFQGCLTQYCFGQQTKPLQHFWEISPDFGDVWRVDPPQQVVQFDVEWLASSQVQDRVQVAQLICQEHNNSSFKSKARARELLIDRLVKNEEPIASRRAMLSAAALLDDGTNAAKLWEVAQADTLSRTTIEKALIKWKSPVALATWRKRLVDPLAKPPELAIAMEGLAIVGGKEDVVALQGLLLGNDTTVTNRHLAARALGQLSSDGLNELTQQILDSEFDQRHLLAAELLSKHVGERTLSQLRTIFDTGSNVAQFIAAQALIAQFPDVAREYAPKMVDHADSTIRILALNLLDKLTDESSLRLQAKLLDDRNVEIRRLAGAQLIRHATEGQRAIVDEFISEHMNAEPWPGIEEAIIMAVSLRDSARCTKFVELLEHPRPEVNMHAGWALMELAQDSAIIASLEPHVEKATAFLEANGVQPPLYKSDTVRLSFLFEVFGRHKYEPMHKLLMKYVPKNGYKMGLVSRASAIWALGQLNSGKDNKELRDALYERIADVAGVPPEVYVVRFSCVLALGEMGFLDSLPTIKAYDDGMRFPLGHACEWATEQIQKANSK